MSDFIAHAIAIHTMLHKHTYTHTEELIQIKFNVNVVSPSNITSVLIKVFHSKNNKSDQIRSVTQSCPTLCNPMNHSMPGLPVHHRLLEFTQTHVLRVSDAIQPSPSSLIPFSSCPQPLPASGSFPMSQLFTWGGQSIGVSASASGNKKKRKQTSQFPKIWTYSRTAY